MVAMRLMHLECQVYVVGETIISSVIRAGDLLIACSESGGSGNVCATAQKAREMGARIVSVTTQAESALGKMSDIVIKIAAAAKQDRSREQSRQFAVSLFEKSTLLLFDALFYVMAQNLNKSAETLWALHTILSNESAFSKVSMSLITQKRRRFVYEKKRRKYAIRNDWSRAHGCQYSPAFDARRTRVCCV